MAGPVNRQDQVPRDPGVPLPTPGILIHQLEIQHHGFWVPDHKNGNAETLNQTKIIANYVEALKGPTILTGDFNLIPTSESLEQINKLLINLSVKNKLETTRNDLTFKNEVCDYIFVNNEIKVKNFAMSEQVVSDHNALILEFSV